MSNRIAFLSAAACLLAVAAVPHPATAADYYDGRHGAAVLHGEDALEMDGDRFETRRDMGPGRFRRSPGPVVFDERDPDSRFGGFRRPGPDLGPGAPGFGYGPRFAPPPMAYGFDAPPPPRYRAVAVPVYDEAFAGAGRPDVGCTVQEAQSITPAGWRKTVTHRTCYRR